MDAVDLILLAPVILVLVGALVTYISGEPVEKRERPYGEDDWSW